jgi:hypothetical protein
MFASSYPTKLHGETLCSDACSTSTDRRQTLDLCSTLVLPGRLSGQTMRCALGQAKCAMQPVLRLSTAGSTPPTKQTPRAQKQP